MNAFKIVAYNLSALVDESSRVRKVFVDLDGYEPLDIVFNRDHWRVKGSASVERIFDIGDVNPLFQISFKSGGSCRVIWNFEAEFYGIVLVDRNVVKVEEGYRVYVPIYFHYDMVKRRCKRKITIDFKGKGECIFQLHIHRNFNHANGFSGIVILTAAGTPCHYKLPLVLLTMGLVPKPLTKDYRLLHKYFTPIIVIGENSATTHTDAIESLEFVLEIAPINVVVVPEEFLNSLVLQCPKLRTKKIVSYKADGDPYKEALNVYRLIFGSSPTIEGIVKASNVKEWFETATYAYLKNLEVVDGTYELHDAHQITNETLFNLRLKLEERILKSKDMPLSNVYPITKYLYKFSREFSEDILGLLSPKEVYREAINMLFRPKLVTITILDEILQIALTATAYAVSRSSPVMVVNKLTNEEMEVIEKAVDHVKGVYEAPLKREEISFQLLKKRILEIQKNAANPEKIKDEVLKDLLDSLTLMREFEEVSVILDVISTILKKHIEPKKVERYVFATLFVEPLALYEILFPYHGIGRLTGVKPFDSTKIVSSSTLAFINPPLNFNAAMIGIGDPKDPQLDLKMVLFPFILKVIFQSCFKTDIYARLFHHDYEVFLEYLHVSNFPKRYIPAVQKTLKLTVSVNKKVVKDVLRKYKLVVIFTHGGKDNKGFYIKAGRFAKLYDQELLKMGPLINRPFILLASCESGRTQLTTNLGVVTALTSKGATVVAPIIPISIKTALIMVEALIFTLLINESPRRASAIAYCQIPRLENFFYILYGEPIYNLKPQLIQDFYFSPCRGDIQSTLETSLTNLIESEFKAKLINNDKRLHTDPKSFIKRYKRRYHEKRAEELLEKAEFLLDFYTDKYTLKEIDETMSKKIIDRVLILCNEAEKLSFSNKKLLNKAKVFKLECLLRKRSIREDDAIDLGLQALKAAELCSNFLDDEDISGFEAWCSVLQIRNFLTREAIFTAIDYCSRGLWKDAWDRTMLAYNLIPKTSRMMDAIVRILHVATVISVCIDYNELKKRPPSFRLLISGFLFWHHLFLLWFNMKSKKTSRTYIKTIRECSLEPIEDLILSSEALFELKQLIDSGKEIVINFAGQRFSYDPGNLYVIYFIERCKIATGIHTFLLYCLIALLIRKELNLFSELFKSDSPSNLLIDILKKCGLPLDILQTFPSDYLDKWLISLMNFEDFKEIVRGFSNDSGHKKLK